MTPNHTLAAAGWMLAAMLVIGFIDNYVARIAREISVWQFFVLRSGIMLPVLGLAAMVGLGRLRVRNAGAVLLRSVLVAIAMLCYFGGLGLLSIAQALAGLYTAPIFILLTSWAVLRQRIGPWRVLAVAMGFSGVLLVLQPNPSDFDARVLLPVMGGFFYALGALVTRARCAGEDTLAMVFGVTTVQALISGVLLAGVTWAPVATPDFLTRGWVWPVAGWPVSDTWGVIWLQALGSILGVYGIVRAYQLGDPTLVSVVEYSVMIFGPGFAFWLFGTPVTGAQGLGIALIAGAGAVIAWRSGEATGARGLVEP